MFLLSLLDHPRFSAAHAARMPWIGHGSHTRLLYPADPAEPAPVDTATPTATTPLDVTPTPTTGVITGCCGDGTVTISDLITAVNNALGMCPVP